MEKLKKAMDRSVQRKLMAENAEQALTLAYNGGLFKITPDLMSFLHLWTVSVTTKSDILYIADSYNNPIKILDQKDFFRKLAEKYKEVMNDWHNEYEEFKKIRKSDQL